MFNLFNKSALITPFTISVKKLRKTTGLRYVERTEYGKNALSFPKNLRNLFVNLEVNSY
jgi:hypothetical protein